MYTSTGNPIDLFPAPIDHLGNGPQISLPTDWAIPHLHMGARKAWSPMPVPVRFLDPVSTIFHEELSLESPILIEGLPGVGNIGKLAAEHLLEELGGRHVASINSRYFPPQVIVGDDGVGHIVANELHVVTDRSRCSRDLVILVGDFQGITPEGQYELSAHLIELCLRLGVEQVITLGGFAQGRLVEEPQVFGACGALETVERMKTFGVAFPERDLGSSGIVGASGLMMGMAAEVGMESVCLLGETSGYFIDPKGAKAVLEILSKILEVEISYEGLEEKAEQVESLTQRLRELDSEPSEKQPEDLIYIG